MFQLLTHLFERRKKNLLTNLSVSFLSCFSLSAVITITLLLLSLLPSVITITLLLLSLLPSYYYHYYPPIIITITLCYHYYPHIIITITLCYHYYPPIIITITLCYHYYPPIIITIILSLLPSGVITIQYYCLLYYLFLSSLLSLSGLIIFALLFPEPKGTVTLCRRKVAEMEAGDWAQSPAQLPRLYCHHEGHIEHMSGMLQVDFANKWVTPFLVHFN